MAKQPAFQFYPGDWLKDANLKRCSHAAKGVWIDMICVMFECEERGVLATAGQAWTEEEIVRVVGGDSHVTLTALRELVRNRVVRVAKSGAYYSARLVRDEDIRQKRKAAGSMGGNPALLNQKGKKDGFAYPNSNQSPNQSDKQNPTPSVSPSGSLEEESAGAQSDSGSHVTLPERPKHAPALEDVQMHFALRFRPELAARFFEQNEPVGWQIAGEPVKNWKALADGWIRKTTNNEAKEAQKATKAAAKNPPKYTPTERDQW